MQTPAGNHLPDHHVHASPANWVIPDEAWRVFLPEDEPVDPLPESSDFDWEGRSNWGAEDWDDWDEAA